MDGEIKVLGHPVHPMVIAYPVAFYTATLVDFVVHARVVCHAPSAGRFPGLLW